MMSNFFSDFFNFLGGGQPTTVINGPASAVRQQVVKQVGTQKTIGDISANNAHLISTVYTCINILSQTVSRLPIIITKKEGSKKVLYTDHKWYSNLQFQPNAYYNSQQFIAIIVSHLYFAGNAFIYIKDFDSKKEKFLDNKELQIIHPDLVEGIAEKKGKMFYKIKGNEDPVIHNDIIHLRLLSKDGIWGLNPIASLKQEINIQHKSEATLSAFLSNNLNTTKVLQQQAGSGNASNETIQEMVDAFVAQGLDGKQGSTLVVPPLHELKELSLNVDSIRLLETGKWTTQQIASLMGVPDHLAGAGGNSHYGKYEEQAIAFKQTTIANIINIITAELSAKLLTIDERKAGVKIEMDVKPLIETDIMSHVNALKVMASTGALSANEFRAEMNLPYIDLPGMNKYFMQMQYIDINTASGTTQQNSVSYLNQG